MSSTEIQRGRTYEYGVPTRECERRGDTEAPVYPKNSPWPKKYPGEYFIDVMGVSSFDEYLTKNPERLSEERIIYFYEVSPDGTKRPVISGNLRSGRSVVPIASSTLSDGQGSPMQQVSSVQQPYYEPPSPTRARVNELQDEVIRLKGEISDRTNTIVENRRTIETLQTKNIELERQAIQARADLDVEKQARKIDTDNLKATHEAALDYERKKHEHELDVLRREVMIQAKADVESTLADNAEKEEPMAERMMAMLGDFMPVFQPLINIGAALLQQKLSSMPAFAQQPQLTPAHATPPVSHPETSTATAQASIPAQATFQQLPDFI